MFLHALIDFEGLLCVPASRHRFPDTSRGLNLTILKKELSARACGTLPLCILVGDANRILAMPQRELC